MLALNCVRYLICVESSLVFFNLPYHHRIHLNVEMAELKHCPASFANLGSSFYIELAMPYVLCLLSALIRVCIYTSLLLLLGFLLDCLGN